MKKVFLILICLIGFSVNAQTSKELIGKWQLVKWLKKGKEKDIKEYYKQIRFFRFSRKMAILKA